MQIQTYDNISIKVLQQSNSSRAMQTACDVTQKKLNLNAIGSKQLGPGLAKYLIKAEHTSIFEHASITFLASGISRSLLAQVTRQRHFSFTSASQHYQDYREYPMVVRPGWDKNEKIGAVYQQTLDDALQRYIDLIALGEKPEEARQVLPNACAVNLVITANPRALSEFLRVRLCRRNTLEMQIFAGKLWFVCMDWLPEIFSNIEKPCKMNGSGHSPICNQGKMSCKIS
jgi:thymidylate synthase (FAD)